MRKEENLTRILYKRDIMVKGIGVELTFDRDFIAEGMDMLKRIQIR